MPNNEVREVVSMVRVSTPGQMKDGKMGLIRQREDIDMFCSPSVFNLKVVQEFQIVTSGKDVQRTKPFRAMLHMLKLPHIAGVVVPALDRLARVDRLSVMAMFSAFEDSGKPLFCELGEMDMNNANHMMMVSLKCQMAGMERTSIRHRTLNARNGKRLEPSASIDKLPKGVEHVRVHEKVNAGNFRYTDFARQSIKPAFARVLRGDTLFSIAEDLGFPSQTALRYALSNEWWIGYKTRRHKIINRVWSDEDDKWVGGKRVAHDKPLRIATNLVETPLVTPETFERVQGMLVQNRTTWTQRTTRLGEFLGAGLLRCASCGAKMYNRQGIRGRVSKYVCANHHTKKAKCEEPLLAAATVDQEIALQAVLYLSDENVVAAKVKESFNAEATEEKRMALRVAEKALAELEKQKARMVKLYALSENEDDSLVVEIQRLTRGIAISQGKVAASAAELKDSISDTDAKGMASVIRRDMAGFATMDRNRQKLMLAKYVESINVRMDEFAGVVIDFKIKIGFPVAQYQMSTYPSEPVRKKPAIREISNEPIRVMRPN